MKCNVIKIKVNDNEKSKLEVSAKVGMVFEKLLKQHWSKLKLDIELSSENVTLFDGETNEQLDLYGEIPESLEELAVYTQHATKA